MCKGGRGEKQELLTGEHVLNGESALGQSETEVGAAPLDCTKRHGVVCFRGGNVNA